MNPIPKQCDWIPVVCPVKKEHLSVESVKNSVVYGLSGNNKQNCYNCKCNKKKRYDFYTCKIYGFRTSKQNTCSKYRPTIGSVD